MAGNVDGKIFWRIAENMSFGEFTLAVKPGLAIMIFITKWLLKRAGIVIGPGVSFGSVRTKLIMKCN